MDHHNLIKPVNQYQPSDLTDDQIAELKILGKPDGYMRIHLDTMVQTNTGHIFIIENESKIVGWAMLFKFSPEFDHHGFMLFVDPGHRHMEIGRKLVDAAKLAVDKIQVWASNKRAYKFYDNCGLIPDD